MLSLLDLDEGSVFFLHIFLRQLSLSLGAALANSPCLAVGDYRELAE